ncbi:MAG: hypothetical protein JO318_21135, partial [Chloroflexi bacterium]|nr:hypothetical protein [Chloroflexota bacterium]
MVTIKRVVATVSLVAMVAAVALMQGAVAVAAAGGPLDGLTVPPADPALVFVAPTPDQPNYSARLDAFLQATVPDTWNGQPVAFLSTLNDTGVDVLGLPTSQPAADPNNPNFIYQRFQNGVLFYNATDDTTS